MKNRHKNWGLAIGVLWGLFGVFALVNAAETVLAGWDRSIWAAPTHFTTGFTGTQSSGGETNGVAVDLWTHEFSREDNDGTFGSIAALGAVDTARSWFVQHPNGLSSSSVYLEYTITNGTADEYALSYFSFDVLRVNSSPDTYVLSMTGDLGTDVNIATGSFPQIGLPSGPSDYPDYDIPLAGMADNTLGAGESVTFRLECTDTNPNLGSNLYIDNIALIGDIASSLEVNVITILITD